MRMRWKAAGLVLALLVAIVSSPVLASVVVNMEFNQAPLVDVFQILGQLGGYNVLVDPAVTGEVSFVLRDLTLEEALDLVTKTTGYGYELVGNTLVISTAQRLKTEFGTEDVRFVSIKHVDVQDAQRLVQLVVPGVRSYVDPELNLLVLHGLTADLQVAERVLAEYDVQGSRLAPPPPEPQAEVQAPEPAPPGEITKYRSVLIAYGDGAEILGLVQRLLPSREFRFDAATGMLVGWTTAEEWEDVALLVQELDVPKFLLKGILRSAEEAVFLVEYRGKTYSLQLGDVIDGWELTSSSEAEVQFSRGTRTVTARIGR